MSVGTVRSLYRQHSSVDRERAVSSVATQFVSLPATGFNVILPRNLKKRQTNTLTCSRGLTTQLQGASAVVRLHARRVRVQALVAGSSLLRLGLQVTRG